MYKLISIALFAALCFISFIAYSNKTKSTHDCIPVPKNYIIDKPGEYCLTKDIKVQDRTIGILIQANNVTLNLNHHKIYNENKKDIENFGILIAAENNIIVKNGIIDGFYYGVQATVNSSEITKLTLQNIKYIAINITGELISIHDNLIKQMDFYYPKNNIDYYLVGITARATRSKIANNKIIVKKQIIENKVYNKLEYVGILINSGSKNCIIADNTLKISKPLKKIENFGIWVAEKSNVDIEDNDISGFLYDMSTVDASAIIKWHRKNKKINNTL